MKLRNIAVMYRRLHYPSIVLVRSFVRTFVHSFFYSFVRFSSIRSLLRSFTCSFTRLFVSSFRYTFPLSCNIQCMLTTTFYAPPPPSSQGSRKSPHELFFVHPFVRCSCVHFVRSFVWSLVCPVIRVLISIILRSSLFNNDELLCPSAHKGRGKGHKDRPRVLGLTTEQCEAFGGSCSASTDCDLSSNVFRGRCDNSTSGCCISKDDVCASRNGTCTSSADCEAESDSHASRLGCSSDDVVCCVAGGRHGGRRQGQCNICNYNALSYVVDNDNLVWLTFCEHV